ncbi:MAG: hypothetical protein GQ578_09755, partial [Desulfuromonadaceae bacterium]|nr:hypothetical protein [Desulfuromonadaceae bacterium]
MKQLFSILLIYLSCTSTALSQDWKSVAATLKAAYRGKIISVEQLNNRTCWAVLSPSLSNKNCVKEAESIGFYIRNSTGGTRGERPSVHVFKSGKHVAVARPSDLKYVGKLSIEDWS